jgi:hypothetical protein
MLRHHGLARHGSQPISQIGMNSHIPDPRPRYGQHPVCSTAKVISGLTQCESRSRENPPFINVSDVRERPQVRGFHLDRPPLRRARRRCSVNRQQQRRILRAALRLHLR